MPLIKRGIPHQSRLVPLEYAITEGGRVDLAPEYNHKINVGHLLSCEVWTTKPSFYWGWREKHSALALSRMPSLEHCLQLEEIVSGVCGHLLLPTMTHEVCRKARLLNLNRDMGEAITSLYLKSLSMALSCYPLWHMKLVLFRTLVQV